MTDFIEIASLLEFVDVRLTEDNAVVVPISVENNCFPVPVDVVNV